MIAALVAALIASAPFGSCDGTGKCLPGQTETCRVHEGAGKAKRSERAKTEFRLRHPCPRTGELVGACPGWEIDHVFPLCCGGADHWSNMRWLEVDLHHLRHKGRVVDCTGFPEVRR